MSRVRDHNTILSHDLRSETRSRATILAFFFSCKFRENTNIFHFYGRKARKLIMVVVIKSTPETEKKFAISRPCNLNLL